MVKTEQGNFVVAMRFAKAAEVSMRTVACGAPLVDLSLDESYVSLVRSSSIRAAANKDRPAGKMTKITQNGRKIQSSVNTKKGVSLYNFFSNNSDTQFPPCMDGKELVSPTNEKCMPSVVACSQFFMRVAGQSTNAGCSLMILAWFRWRCLQTQSPTLFSENNRMSRDHLGLI